MSLEIKICGLTFDFLIGKLQGAEMVIYARLFVVWHKQTDHIIVFINLQNVMDADN